jgi:hypothetical protein
MYQLENNILCKILISNFGEERKLKNSVHLIGHVLSVNQTMFTIEVPRTSGKSDILNIIKPKDSDPIKMNTTVDVEGCITCKNNAFVVKASKVLQVDQDKEMPPDNNKVLIHGTLRTNPTLRITSNGNTVSDLGIDIGIKDHNQYKIIWCIAYRQVALTAIEMAKNGSKVEIEGRLERRTFFSVKENQEKTVTEIAIFKLTILDKKEATNAAKKNRKRAA